MYWVPNVHNEKSNPQVDVAAGCVRYTRMHEIDFSLLSGVVYVSRFSNCRACAAATVKFSSIQCDESSI